MKQQQQPEEKEDAGDSKLATQCKREKGENKKKKRKRQHEKKKNSKYASAPSLDHFPSLLPSPNSSKEWSALSCMSMWARTEKKKKKKKSIQAPYSQ